MNKWIVSGKFILLLFLLSSLNYCSEQTDLESKEYSEEPKGVKNGIHLATGLVYAEGFDIVSAACTGCHSGKLIAQNKATREGWIEMIRWMQKTQGLGDLGEFEPAIVEYLATHYAPEQEGRRMPLNPEQIEWYILEED